jgi:hypothetical protein
MTAEALEAKLEKRVELGVDGLSCPTCGAPVVKELQRQLEELRERLKVIEQRK